MKSKIILRLVFIFSILLSTNVFTQITPTKKSAVDLVKILVGNNPNVTITAGSEKITGYEEQFGGFTGGSSNNFLLDKGIVLTTGNIDDTHPNVPKYDPSIENSGQDYQSTLLANLVNTNKSNTYNTATLEFKFKAPSNKISFNYIFASVEYPGFVCTDYFDLFGFFISGPNPAGGNYTNQNIALVPGSNKIVCINTINSGSLGTEAPSSDAQCDNLDPQWKLNTHLYNDNVPSGGDMYGSAKIMSNGFTDILTANADIVCNEEYTIKLIICDIGDSKYDSYVYLEEGSFKTSGITASNSITDASGNPIVGNYLTEGCSKAVLTVNVSPTPTSNYTLNYTSTTGTAQTADYNLTTSQAGNPSPATSLVIPANQSSGTITIDAVKDGISDAGETIIISLPGSCGAASNDITITLKDVVTLSAIGTDPTCNGASVNTDGEIKFTAGGGNNSSYNYSTDNGTTYATTNPVKSLAKGSYNLKVKDGDGCTATSTVTLNQPICNATGCTAPIISKQPKDAKLCEGSDTSFTANATGTSLSYQWQEDKGTGFTNLPLETFTTLKRTAVTSSSNGYKYRCVVTEATNGPCSTNSNPVTLTVDTKPTATAGGSTTICSSGTAIVSGVTASTGTTYSWTSDGAGGITNGTTLTPTYTPIASDGGKTITLTMKTVSGNSCPNPADVTYSVIVDQPQTASAGGSTTICSDATATVSGATATAGTTYSWTSDGTGSISNGSSTLTPTYTPISSDAGKKVTLTMKTVSSNKCPNPADVTYTINVDPLPTATAGGSKTICSSSTATVSGAAFTNGTYAWGHDGHGTISNGTTLTPTYTPISTDEGNTVTLTLTVTSNNTCSSSASKIATATYTIDVTAGVTTTATAGGSSTICMTKAATVSGASSSNGTILWTHNGHGSLTSETTITPTYTSAVADTLTPVTLTLTVTPTAGCGGNNATDTYTVNVKSNPKVVPTSTQPCDGKDVQLNANTIFGAQYVWTGPNGYSQPTQSATITSVTGTKIGTYTLQITDANNCINSADVNVTVNPNPTLSGDNLVCVGKTFKLTASTSSNATSWVSQKTANLTIDPSTGVATGVLGGTSDVTFTDINTCTATKTITVEDLPVVLFTVDSTSVCLGNDVKFTDKSPVKYTNILWDFGDGTNSIDIDPSYTYLKIDSFTVTLTATSPNGCVGSLTKTKYITPIDVPNMNFVFTPDSIDIYNPVVQFKNLSNAKFYTWVFNDYSPVSYLKDPLHIFPNDPGQSYTVVLKGSNSISGVCPASVVHEITSIDPAIFYIPNTFTPNADEINNTFQPIFTSGYDPQNYSLWIYNRLGELVFESHNSSVGWDGTYNNIIAENNTYVWKLQFKSKQTNKEYYRTGHVNLVK